jgi:hypothetical protein
LTTVQIATPRSNHLAILKHGRGLVVGEGSSSYLLTRLEGVLLLSVVVRFTCINSFAFDISRQLFVHAVPVFNGPNLDFGRISGELVDDSVLTRVNGE